MSPSKNSSGDLHVDLYHLFGVDNDNVNLQWIYAAWCNVWIIWSETASNQIILIEYAGYLRGTSNTSACHTTWLTQSDLWNTIQKFLPAGTTTVKLRMNTEGWMHDLQFNSDCVHAYSGVGNSGRLISTMENGLESNNWVASTPGTSGYAPIASDMYVLFGQSNDTVNNWIRYTWIRFHYYKCFTCKDPVVVVEACCQLAGTSKVETAHDAFCSMDSVPDKFRPKDGTVKIPICQATTNMVHQLQLPQSGQVRVYAGKGWGSDGAWLITTENYAVGQEKSKHWYIARG